MESRLNASQINNLDQYLSILADIDAYSSPAKFMNDISERLSSSASSRGRLFELALCEVLKQEGITPFYYQVRFTPRSIVDFDVLLYQSPNRPLSFSLKTSLRERWKQSYLEAVILKGVYPAARCYLLTLNEGEAERMCKRMDEEHMIELDGCLLATSEGFDALIAGLREEDFEQIEAVRLFEGKKINGPV